MTHRQTGGREHLGDIMVIPEVMFACAGCRCPRGGGRGGGRCLMGEGDGKGSEGKREGGERKGHKGNEGGKVRLDGSN